MSRMKVIHVLLTSSGQEWQFHIGLMTSSGQQWKFITLATVHLVVKNGNFTLLLTSSGQE